MKVLPPHDVDRLVAAVDLVGRSGATNFELGWLDDDVPVEDARWWAKAQYRGARLTVEDHAGPVEAAEALACRILDGGTCTHCGGTTVIGPAPTTVGAACRWTRTGNRWERGCVTTHPERLSRAERRRRARAEAKAADRSPKHDQARHPAPAHRPVAFRPDDDVAVLAAWCQSEDQLEECRTKAHDAIIRMLGDRRRSGVSWMQETAADAHRLLDNLAAGEKNPELIEHYGRLRTMLSDWAGSWVVVAMAKGERT